MQLKKAGSISQQLATAVIGLISATPVIAASSNGSGNADLTGLYYQEGDHRVSVTEAVFTAGTKHDDGTGFTFNFTYDTLSGGSPNGALASKATQTFTGPSGSSLSVTPAQVSQPVTHTCTTPSGRTYVCGTSGGEDESYNSVFQVAAQQTPLAQFHDERKAIHMADTLALLERTHLTLAGGFSTETDFQAIDASLQITQDFNQKNTTVFGGASLEHDAINPIGGAPVPWTQYDHFAREGNQTKDDNGYLLGVTQVMNRRWLVQLNYAHNQSNGYQNDPYKIVSVLNANGSNATDTDLDNVSRFKYVYESRPEQRTKSSVFIDNRVALDHDTIALAVRHLTDDWGITSNTAELRYRLELGNGPYLEPHYRWYRQTAADFYRLYLLTTDNEAYVSADPRLGEMTATTLGVKWGTTFHRTSEASLKVDYYRQANVVTQPVLTQLQGLDLVPGLTAWIVQGDLQFRF